MVARVAGSVPERVELAVLGSAPGHGGVFPDEMVDALMAGDWGSFLEATAGMGEREVYATMAADNDPVAIGAILRARGEMQYGWLEVPVVAYVGDGELGHRLSRADAHQFGFPWAVLPAGKHEETFATIDPVMDLVSLFLPN